MIVADYSSKESPVPNNEDKRPEALEHALADNARLRAELAACRQTVSSQRAAEVKYQCLYNNMADVFVGVAMNGQLIEFNPALQTMLGYSAEERYQLTYRDLTPTKWHAFESTIIHEQILSLGHSCVYEKEYQRKDGGYRWLTDSGILITDPDGTPLYHVGVARDVTDRKRMEDALRKSNERLEITVAERTVHANLAPDASSFSAHGGCG